MSRRFLRRLLVGLSLSFALGMLLNLAFLNGLFTRFQQQSTDFLFKARGEIPAAHRTGTESKMCIYRAHADGAHGPFVDDFDGPIECPDSTLWAIDPYPVRDAHGDWHLLARVDEPNGVNTIQIRKLGEYGQHLANGSNWVKLTQITKGGWEEPVMENASIVRLDANGEKRWYVFYSGGSYRNNSYGVGYADCGTSIDGPCVKKTVGAPWLSSQPAIHMYGPGTPTFYRDGNGHTIMAVKNSRFLAISHGPRHGKNYEADTYRLQEPLA